MSGNQRAVLFFITLTGAILFTMLMIFSEHLFYAAFAVICWLAAAAFGAAELRTGEQNERGGKTLGAASRSDAERIRENTLESAAEIELKREAGQELKLRPLITLVPETGTEPMTGSKSEADFETELEAASEPDLESEVWLRLAALKRGCEVGRLHQENHVVSVEAAEEFGPDYSYLVNRWALENADKPPDGKRIGLSGAGSRKAGRGKTSSKAGTGEGLGETKFSGVDELKKLAELKKSGMLTEDEFSEVKRKLIEKM